jgi:uncharacterized protein YlxW (UPF0749 family)
MMERGVKIGPRMGSRDIWFAALSFDTRDTLVAVPDEPRDGDPGRPGSPGPRRRGWSWWRVATPVAVVVAGGLFVVSAQSSEGTDLRPGRYDDLAGLTQSEADQYAALQRKIAALNKQVAQLTAQVHDDTVQQYQRQVDALKEPAGLSPREGPGVSVTLSDAPSSLIEATRGDKNLLVVHQQDIQAVVNAMWAGGARAVTVQGQRIVSTTGIKCEGSSVVLQGVPYPQPYVITAVGNVNTLTSAIADDDYLELYREQSADPTIDVGWDLEIRDDVRAPAYGGLLDLAYATPVTRPAGPTG